MNLKDIIDKNSEQTVTNLYGEEIIISRERKIYADIYSKYEIVARESTAIFQRLYSEHYDILKKVEMVRDGVVSDFHASIKMVIDEIRADLTSIGIYDYTNESVMKKAEGEGFFDDFKEVYTNICESINRIDNELVGEKEYRENRKEKRSKWEGSSVSSDLVNLAGDLAHSFANVIGNSISEADAKKNKQKLYTDDLKKVFVKAVYDVCLNMHMFVVNSLGNVEIFMGDDVMTHSDKRTASRIMENYKSLSADDNTALNMLKDAIKANPFEMDTYKELIDRFGDSDNSLVVYGSCFNIDVKNMKNNMVTLKYKRIYESIDNEDELKSKETDIRNLVNKYGLEFEETEVFHLYNTKLKELDLEYRIVDDIIFLERDEADMARNELAEINKYMESLDEPRYMDDSYERQLIETKEKISICKTSIKDKYINQVNQLINDYDGNYRTVDGIIFDTREDANSARKEKDKIEKMMQDLSGTMEEIDSKYEEMLLHVKDEILKCKTQIKDSYLSQISSKLEEYDEFYRTEAYFGERTIFSTREEADKAREEIKYIENVLKDVSAPARDSFLDYKDDIEKKIKDISDNTTTIVKEPCLKLLNSYLDEFDRLYLDTGVLFKSKNIEEASRKRFTNAFKFNSMDLSSYEKIDYAWKQIDEYIVRLKMTREQLNAELAPMYLAENALNSVDGCCFDTREDAENARMELAGINKILADVTLSDSVDIRYEEKINEALNNIRNFKTNIKNKYIAILSEELDKFDLRYKTVDGIVFSTREEAEEARRELTAIFQLLDGVRPPDKNSMLDYETNVKEKLNIIQSDYHTVIAEKYAEVLKKYLLDFDVTFRNVSLFGDKTREDAAQKRLMNEMSRLKFTCWEDVDNAKIFLDDITHKLGIDRNLVPEYDKMIENKENILKTIDGIHFDTREDADMARKEYESIKNLLSDVRPPKKTDYLDYEWKIREKLDKLNVNYTTVIKNKYIELMNKYLADFDDVFCRISMFKRGTREEAARTKALKFVKEAKLTSTMDVETTRKNLMELLPFLGLQQADVVEAEQYLDQKKDEIVNGAPANSGNGKFGKFFKT